MCFQSDELEGECVFDHVESDEGQELLLKACHSPQRKICHMESRSVRWRCLKPHLEVSLQNSNLKAFPTEDLDGFFHEINFQSFQLCCGGNCQDIDLFQVDNHSTSGGAGRLA